MDDFASYRFGLYNISLILEEVTEYDSIRTIKSNYARTERGSFKCPMPRCNVVHRDPYRMWKHVHFTKAHGYAFNMSWIQFAGLIDD